MKHPKKINIISIINNILLFIIPAIIYVINVFIYGGLFSNLLFCFYLSFVLISLIFILISKIVDVDALKKIYNIQNALYILIGISLLLICIFNLPQYTYSQAAIKLGEIKYKQGAKSFEYSTNASSTESEKYANFFIRKDYWITTIVDGNEYIYFYNPYNNTFKEIHVIDSISDLKKSENFKLLY